MKNGWTLGYYSAFRAALAVYLFVHFAQLLPWGTEVFSHAGALTPASASPLAHLFPNILSVVDGPAMVRGVLVIGLLATIPLALGVFDRSAAVVLWYIWACLFGRNPLISNPSLPFVGWLLLAHTLVPKTSRALWREVGATEVGSEWRMPELLFGAAWVVMSTGYFYSGMTKLVSPSWVDGSALSRILDNPLARPGQLRVLLLALPAGTLRLATWGALALELVFAPLALFRSARPWIWVAMVGMHFGLLLFVDFADLTCGMLLLHFFTFDPAWIASRRTIAKRTRR